MTQDELTRLITQAQRGCQESLDRLSEQIRGPLEEYAYRLTLDRDSAQDIAQETMLTLFKVLGQLKKPDRFWPWVYRIAFRKMLTAQKKNRRHKELVCQLPQPSPSENPDGLARVVSEELQQIVMHAMREIKPRHRQVLTLRCYADLEYSEIAEAMDRSEFSVRMLFWRAKKSLQKQLSRRGFTKGALLTALVVFGKMTAQSEASAAQMAVAGGSLQVGATAAAAGALGTKAGIITVLAAGILATGVGVTSSDQLKRFFSTPESQQVTDTSTSWQATTPDQDRLKEFWYYYPDGNKGPLMLRTVAQNAQSGYSYCQWLQNAHCNYFYDPFKNTVFMTNYRLWQQDLSVLRLPTDPPEFTSFLSRVEGTNYPARQVKASGPGLWIVVKNRTASSEEEVWVTHDHNTLKAEYFQFPWPTTVRQTDCRDRMHQRGWTYFTIAGEIRNTPVQGRGRIPFVAAAIEKNSPWFTLEVGEHVIIHDRDTLEGSFFRGMPRPWTGFHTIDTVRRDAAEQALWFETRRTNARNRLQVILSGPEGRNLVYTINMKKDVIKKIQFLNPEGEQEGELYFNYNIKPGGETGEYSRSRSDGYGEPQREGILWLWELAKD